VYKRRITLLHSGLSQTSFIFPIMAGMPAYLAGNVTFGGLMQLQSAFSMVSGSLEWFAQRYEMIAQWKARVDRILTFDEALNNASIDQQACGFSNKKTDDKQFSIENFTLQLPNGKTLLSNVSMSFKEKSNLLITAESGSGKSTLFRAISGLWVWGQGQVSMPNKSIMFVPQKAYMPVATLREVMCYPLNVKDMNDTYIKEVMELCRLGSFSTRLNETENWARILSGGEQQRVAFVRAILAKPDWLFLDEATSALDQKTESALYSALHTALPTTTVVSISHRVNGHEHFDTHLQLNAETQSLSLQPYS
jgi:putative ATP-binding cassette transporter